MGYVPPPLALPPPPMAVRRKHRKSGWSRTEDRQALWATNCGTSLCDKTELVSVQPEEGPVGMVFKMNTTFPAFSGAYTPPQPGDTSQSIDMTPNRYETSVLHQLIDRGRLAGWAPVDEDVVHAKMQVASEPYQHKPKVPVEKPRKGVAGVLQSMRWMCDEALRYDPLLEVYNDMGV